MNTGAMVVGASLLSAALAAGTVAAVQGGREPRGPAARDARAAPSDAGALARRVDALEGRVAELAAALDAARAEAAAARAEAAKEAESLRGAVAKERERADAAASLIAGYTGDPTATGSKEPPMDAFARQVSNSMRSGMEEEFRRVAELIVAPTPEALDLRRKQLKMFANALGVQAGLDQAQIATLERVLETSEAKARDDLRPLLVGQEDFRTLDYAGIKRITNDTFATQDAEFEQSFPKEKSERLKKGLDPVRKLFSAMLEDLDRTAKAATEPPK
jgi:outer membrane murein-binding lipoprotein Lpp